MTFEPSPLLQLARDERAFGITAAKVRSTPPSDAPTSDEPAPEDPKDTQLDDDGIVRQVRVKRGGLATPEDLAAAVLRNAEARRPRELHPARFLVRTALAVGGRSKGRQRARSWIRAQRPAIKTCLLEQQASRVDVIVRAPSALVVEQATRTGPISYTIEVGFAGGRTPSLEVDPPVNERTNTCLSAALLPSKTLRLGRVRVRLSAFSQGAHGFGGSGLHHALANEAATLGWIEYERGAYDEALAFFEDAYWLYHRAEYQLLIGMALQQLGRIDAAVASYRAYVDERPHASDTPMLVRRIETLTAQL